VDNQGSTPPFPQRLRGDSAYCLARGRWPHQAIRSSRIELPGTLEAAAHARRAVELHLGGVVGDPHLRDLCLMASELVTNAIVHGEGSAGVVMHLAAAQSCLRVEVWDRGSGFDFSRASQPRAAARGLGLRILDVTASRWGVAGDEGTSVWFELDL
jgi:anti-sigma regulatory factor (Ser/Thr protein kinase)